MNRQEIIAMAEECDLTDKDLGQGMTDYGNATEAILKFAALVAAKEREECALLFNQPHWEYAGDEIQSAIRARGQQ